MLWLAGSNWCASWWHSFSAIWLAASAGTGQSRGGGFPMAYWNVVVVGDIASLQKTKKSHEKLPSGDNIRVFLFVSTWQHVAVFVVCTALKWIQQYRAQLQRLLINNSYHKWLCRARRAIPSTRKTAACSWMCPVLCWRAQTNLSLKFYWSTFNIQQLKSRGHWRRTLCFGLWSYRHNCYKLLLFSFVIVTPDLRPGRFLVEQLLTTGQRGHPVLADQQGKDRLDVMPVYVER